MKKTMLVVLGSLMVMVVIMAFSLNSSRNTSTVLVVKKDSIASVAAFKQVYTVLMSARCMNCHPSGDVPLQGDDRHLHTMLPKRGIDGKGIYAMKCSNCHQPTNTPVCIPLRETLIGMCRQQV